MTPLCSAATASEIVLDCLGTSSHDKHICKLEKLQEEVTKAIRGVKHLPPSETTRGEWDNKGLLKKTRVIWRGDKECKDELPAKEATQ